MNVNDLMGEILAGWAAQQGGDPKEGGQQKPAEKSKRPAKSQTFGAVLPQGAFMKALTDRMAATGQPVYQNGHRTPEAERVWQAIIAENWPNVSANQSYGDVPGRSDMNRAFASSLEEATGQPFTVFASHGAQYSLDALNKGTLQSAREFNWPQEEVAQQLQRNPTNPLRVGVSMDFVHKSTPNPLTGAMQAGKAMTVPDLVRLANSDELPVDNPNALISMCMRGGPNGWQRDQAMCDSIQAIQKSGTKNIFIPRGPTSANSEMTGSGMMLFPPGGGAPMLSDQRNVKKAVKELTAMLRGIPIAETAAQR